MIYEWVEEWVGVGWRWPDLFKLLGLYLIGAIGYLIGFIISILTAGVILGVIIRIALTVVRS